MRNPFRSPYRHHLVSAAADPAPAGLLVAAVGFALLGLVTDSPPVLALAGLVALASAGLVRSAYLAAVRLDEDRREFLAGMEARIAQRREAVAAAEDRGDALLQAMGQSLDDIASILRNFPRGTR